MAVCTALTGEAGPAHELATALRDTMVDLESIIQGFETIYVASPVKAVHMAIRVMYWVQQRAFNYWDKLIKGRAATVPNFEEFLDNL